MCLIGLLSTAHADNVVTLASLEWPPYAGAQLPEQGTANAVVRAAFAAMDFRLDIKFFPWSRAVSLVETQYNYIGYTPEYDLLGSLGAGSAARQSDSLEHDRRFIGLDRGCGARTRQWPRIRSTRS